MLIAQATDDVEKMESLIANCNDIIEDAKKINITVFYDPYFGHQLKIAGYQVNIDRYYAAFLDTNQNYDHRHLLFSKVYNIVTINNTEGLNLKIPDFQKSRDKLYNTEFNQSKATTVSLLDNQEFEKAYQQYEYTLKVLSQAKSNDYTIPFPEKNSLRVDIGKGLAQISFDKGLALMGKNQYRGAYEEFSQAKNWYSSQPEVGAKMQECITKGTVRVLVKPGGSYRGGDASILQYISDKVYSILAQKYSGNLDWVDIVSTSSYGANPDAVISVSLEEAREDNDSDVMRQEKRQGYRVRPYSYYNESTEKTVKTECADVPVEYYRLYGTKNVGYQLRFDITNALNGQKIGDGVSGANVTSSVDYLYYSGELSNLVRNKITEKQAQAIGGVIRPGSKFTGQFRKEYFDSTDNMRKKVLDAVAQDMPNKILSYFNYIIYLKG